MDFRHELVGLGNNHRAGLKRLIGLFIRPLIPEPGYGQRRRAFARREMPWLFTARRLALVVAGNGNEAAFAFKGAPEERLFRNRLGTSVEGGELQFLDRLRPPAGNKALAGAN